MEMELTSLQLLPIQRIRRAPTHEIVSLSSPPSCRRRQRRWKISLRATAETTALEQAGGKMVVELVGAFNELTERMNVLSTSSSRILFKALKLSIPILQNLPLSPDHRSPLNKALSLALLLADLQAKRLKAIMMAAAELAALRLKDLPSAKGIAIDQRDRVFQLLDKNGDGRISIEELMEVMEELGAPGEDAREMMQLLDANSDGSLSPDEFNTFQKQVEFMHNLEDKDHQYRSILNEKLQMAEDSGLIQVYSKELGIRLAS